VTDGIPDHGITRRRAAEHRSRTCREVNDVTERYVDDADWSTAAEQSSEDDEAQEGNILASQEHASDNDDNLPPPKPNTAAPGKS
jgi:hypothetical protein